MAECTIGILKLGCIGAAPLLDLLLDERAERKEINVRTVGSGATLDAEPCLEAAKTMAELKPDFIIIVSPNAAVPGVTGARNHLIEAGFKVLSISDAPSKKAFFKKNEEGKKVASVPEGSGFIILPMDPMIGARKEFLDPTEMALFNADLIKLLANTGVLRFLQYEMEKLIDAVKAKKDLELPQVTLKTKKALKVAGFDNPYAWAKAYAALEMAPVVADITSKACFRIQDAAEYVPMVTAAHELLRTAALLSDEAREIEKYGDSVLRTPHSSSGENLSKTKLADKPK
jgi:methylenetetrahydromethanopterin dehydrogenase